MALAYIEFDTTAQNLLKDLRTNILLSSDWADITPAPSSTTLTASAAVGASSFTVGSTAAFAVGDVVVFEPGTANEERKTITAITNATTFATASNNSLFAHASGSTVRHGRMVLKATTTRGAQMVVDLAGSVLSQQLQGLYPVFYRQHDGTVAGAVDPTPVRYVFFRTNTTGAVYNMPVHVVVSASKEHLFVSVEGPRAWETGASSTQYGSLKQYMFMADLAPYNAADTNPVIVTGAGISNSPNNSVALGSHMCFVSRNYANTTSWTPGRLASLSVPNIGAIDQPGLKRKCSIDGNTYVFPYVFFDDIEGMRGRLTNLYYAGSNAPSGNYDEPTTLGDTSTYAGNTLKTIATDKNDGGSNDSWGPLGIAENSSANSYQSTVIAVPIA